MLLSFPFDTAKVQTFFELCKQLTVFNLFFFLITNIFIIHLFLIYVKLALSYHATNSKARKAVAACKFIGKIMLSKVQYKTVSEKVCV